MKLMTGAVLAAVMLAAAPVSLPFEECGDCIRLGTLLVVEIVVALPWLLWLLLVLILTVAADCGEEEDANAEELQLL